jgi:hypothetical protein
MLKLPLYDSNREFRGLLDLSLVPALTNFNTKLLLGLDIVAYQVPLLSESICPIPLLQKTFVFFLGDSHVGIALK